LKFLGKDFIKAFELYQGLGNCYYDNATKDRRFLQSAKKCYVIAAENAITIANLYPQENETRIEMQKQAKQNLFLAQEIENKIKSDPSLYDY
jgi:hypothetical protein